MYVAGDEPIIAWALQRQNLRTVEGESVQFAPIEYVIVYKLRYFQLGGSDRHLRDVARMLEISGSEVDEAALNRWIGELDLGAAWDRARALSAQEE